MGREAEVCWAVLPWPNKEMVQHMQFVFERILRNTSEPKERPIKAWLTTLMSLRYSNQFVHLEKDIC